MLRKLEKYDILEEIGHGGMATVYRARDSHLDRPVALKVLHPHLQSADEARSRFAREARSVARLRHPNVMEVFDFSGEESEQSYIASELLTGPTLKQFAEAHSGMPAEVAACFVIQIARALAAAHEQGIIHRDVKPENVLIHEDRCVKLTDFGIAQMVDAQSFTATGQILGSPGHMAPEQVEGGDCDARTDLFSLGTVLYYLAVGRLPFTGRNPHQVLKRIMDGDYPDPLRVRPSVGGKLQAIIHRALQIAPEQRYQCAEEFERDLLGFLGDIGVDEPDALLERYLQDPDTTGQQLERQAVEQLTRCGERAADEGDIPGALDYFNRVLALDEGNERVLEQIERVGRRADRRRQALVWAGVALGVLGLVLAGVGYTVAGNRNAGEPVAQAASAARGPTSGDAGTGARSSGGAQASDAGSAPSDAGAVRLPSVDEDAAATAVAGAVDADAAPGESGGSDPQPTRAAQRARNRSRPRKVVFRPVPQNVLISVDGAEPKPFGPSFRQVKLSPGVHRFRFIGGAECCKPEEFRRRIPPGPGRTVLSPELEFRPARIYVVANVPADVVIDHGRVEGRTRDVLRVPMDGFDDVVDVSVTAPGYEDYTGEVRLRAGKLVQPPEITLEASESSR